MVQCCGPSPPRELTIVTTSQQEAACCAVTWEGWGTSLCWFAHALGGNPTACEAICRLLFSKDNGLGFNIVRCLSRIWLTATGYVAQQPTESAGVDWYAGTTSAAPTSSTCRSTGLGLLCPASYNLMAHTTGEEAALTGRCQHQL